MQLLTLTIKPWTSVYLDDYRDSAGFVGLSNLHVINMSKHCAIVLRPLTSVMRVLVFKLGACLTRSKTIPTSVSAIWLPIQQKML